METLKNSNPNPQQIKSFCNFLANHKKKHPSWIKKKKKKTKDSGGSKRNLSSS
jgi:hypothetical protein